MPPRVERGPLRPCLRLAAGAMLAALWAAPVLGVDLGAPPPLPPAPAEPAALPFDIDWSLGLRGAYVLGADEPRYEAIATPAVSLTHRFMRGGYSLEAEAELAADSLGNFRLGAFRLAADGTYALDAVTEATARLDLSVERDAPGDPADPAALAEPAAIARAEAEAALARRFGRFSATVRGSATRTRNGEAHRYDGTVVDNSASDSWALEGGLRLGYEMTPVITAFVDGSAGVQLYDNVSPVYLARLDATDYALRGGLSAQWTSVLEAEASVGIGLRQFVEPGFAEIVSTLYDARLVFRPDETLTVEGSLATTIGAPDPDIGGTASIAYAADLAARYVVNPWLAVRASGGWRYETAAGASGSETGWEAGAGLDYLLNAYTTLNADYGYEWTEDSGGPGEAEHRVMLGVTFSRPQDGS